MKNLVTIIVPVYNSSSFLCKCVDSLLSQTYEKIEIILVNDGSSDDSEKICLEYQKKDNRINYIAKENGGASSARNLGLEMAKGRFVTFVDSDDYVGKEYIYDMVCAHDDLDDTFVISGMRLQKGGKLEYFTYASECVTKGNIIYDLQKKRFFLHGGPTGKLFCLTLIKRNNISFNTNLNNYEDLIFCLTYLSHVSTVKYIESTEYVYILDNMSMGKTLNGFDGELSLYDLYSDRLAAIDKDYLRKIPNTAMYGNVFLVRAILAYVRSSTEYNYKCKRNFSLVYTKIRIKDFDISISKKQYLAFFLLKNRYFLLLYYFCKKIYSNI